MTQYDSRISVIDPIMPAIERVKTMLFKPFDLAKWFAVGFCAWLANLGQASFGCKLNPFGGWQLDAQPDGLGTQRPEVAIQQLLARARDFVVENIASSVSIAVILLLLRLSSSG